MEDIIRNWLTTVESLRTAFEKCTHPKFKSTRNNENIISGALENLKSVVLFVFLVMFCEILWVAR